MNEAGEKIDPNRPEFGTIFDKRRDEFTVFQAAMLWTGQEPAEDGMFRDDIDARWRLDKYVENRSVFDALIVAIERGEFSIIPMKTKSGEVDGFRTPIPRGQLTVWAEKHGGIPDFLRIDGRNETPAERRSKHDMTTERGCRRLILENWDTIEKLHGSKADGRQVLRVISRNKDDDQKKLALKTVQNNLKILRNEKLIP